MTQAASEVFTHLTPSGIEVSYQAQPKRMYRVRITEPCSNESERCAANECGCYEWCEVPSVTTVLGVLDKPALPWWGMKVGVEGTISLFNTGKLQSGHLVDSGQRVMTCAAPIAEGGRLVVAGVDRVVDLLSQEKLTVNHVKSKAGDRGIAVHDALEFWAESGELPDPAMYPAEQAGYIEGVVAFLKDADPEPVESEVMVGSVEHAFAGRYDLRLRITEPRRVVKHRTPKRGPQYAIVAPGVLLTDLKTSSGVYDSHSLQLEGYELASVECGYEPTAARGILHVGREGTYEFVPSAATGEDFLAVLETYRALERVKQRRKKK